PTTALPPQDTTHCALDEVTIPFDAGALRASPRQALKRGTGARGLRAILEEKLLHVMFELPSREDVVEVKVTEACIVNDTPPLLEIAPAPRKKKEACAGRPRAAVTPRARTPIEPRR
ncbi:MAG: hypothetical protein ACK6AH_10735, partial [Gemmatimonadota bacterium]